MDEKSGDWECKRKRDGDLSPDARISKKARSEPTQLIEDISDKSQDLVSTTKDILTSPQNQPAEPAPYISRKAVALIKEQLCQLISKTQRMKNSMEEMSVTLVGELMSIMETRRAFIEHLGRHDMDKEMRQPHLDLLMKHQQHMVAKEDELLSLGKLLSFQEAILAHAESARTELEEKIQAFEEDKQWDSSYTIEGFPEMSALARFTGSGEEYFELVCSENVRPVQSEATKPSFTIFMTLPFEVRLQIWEACLPGPRVITHDSRHNRRLVLLGACQESRTVMQKYLTPILSPGDHVSVQAINLNYVNPEIDIVVRDLTMRLDEQPSVFDMHGHEFYNRCSALFSGLANIKHLALAFDLQRHSGGDLFSPLQACCPQLQTLILFPSSQLEGVVHRRPYHPELRFLDLDSNLLDFVSFKRSQLQDRKLRQNSRRGIRSLWHIANIALQYKRVYIRYLEKFKIDWNPVLKVCMLTNWNEIYKGYQTGKLDSDRISGLHKGDDGKSYDGFIESNMICDANGEILSRYDGIKELFGNT